MKTSIHLICITLPFLLTTTPFEVARNNSNTTNVTSRTKVIFSKECTIEAPCGTSADCGEGKGFCVNARGSQTCVCLCNDFAPCRDDGDCGDLRGACDNSFCNCAKVYGRHGYANFFDVLLRFCDKKPCESEDDCFGSPCIYIGFCVCPKKAN